MVKIWQKRQTMLKFHCVVLAAFTLALGNGSWAATPDQVGTWVGTLKTKVRKPSGVTATKSTMLVQIAADDTTTVTLDGQIQIPATTIFSAGEGLIAYIDPLALPATSQTIAVVHFKGKKLKGTTSGLTVTTELTEAFSGKFSLKKL
jgi:hypothetical protein